MVYLLIRLKLFIFLFSTHFFVHFIDYSPGANIILSSDSHNIDTLDFGFKDAKELLQYIGFTELITIDDGKFKKYYIRG